MSLMSDNHHRRMSSTARFRDVPVVLDTRVTYLNAPPLASGYKIIVRGPKANGDTDTRS